MKFWKNIAIGAISITGLAFSQGAWATWNAGTCPSGVTPCIEQDFNGSTYYTTTQGALQGDVNGDSFVFEGVTDLSCSGLPTATCDLTLEGKVNILSGGSTINITVDNGSVSGSGLLCGVLSVDSFDWYLASNSTTTGFGPSTGVAYGSSPYVGAFGTITVPPVITTPSYVKDVTYDNAGTFSFNSDLYEEGTTTSTNCSVVGDLDVQTPVSRLTIK